MSISRSRHQVRRWWDRLGLNTSDSLGMTGTETARLETQVSVLGEFTPIAFQRAGSEEQFTLAEVETAVSEAGAAYDRLLDIDIAARLQREQQLVDDALAATDADEVVTEGAWKGFTRGRAVAWNWNLFQYEPRGLVHPGSQLRVEAIRKLEAGELPEVFGYPERARALEDQGLTPLEYRRLKKALGAKSFDQADVSYGR